MNKIAFAPIISVAFGFLLGCAPHRAPAPSAGATGARPAVDPALARLPLHQRLAQEVASRPASDLPVERMQQALARNGLALQRWRQVLGSPIGARFCMAGVTRAGVAVAVCEFGDPTAAARGLHQSRARFDRLIPERELIRNRATLLTVSRPGKDPLFRTETRRLLDIFAAL